MVFYYGSPRKLPKNVEIALVVGNELWLDACLKRCMLEESQVAELWGNCKNTGDEDASGETSETENEKRVLVLFFGGEVLVQGGAHATELNPSPASMFLALEERHLLL